MGDTLAEEADEGRGVTTKRLGEVLPTFDPGISEWGNLPSG